MHISAQAIVSEVQYYSLVFMEKEPTYQAVESLQKGNVPMFQGEAGRFLRA